MKIDPRISAELARLEPNQVGVLAWSLLAHPPINMAGVSPVNLIQTPPMSNLRSLACQPCRMSRLPRQLPDNANKWPVNGCPLGYQLTGHISLSPITKIRQLSSFST